MTNYEYMLQCAADRGLYVIEYIPLTSGAAALVYDNVICLSKRLTSYTEKACILAEEIAHHDTNVGDILDQTDVSNRKQEQRARRKVHDSLIGLEGLIRCFQAGDRNLYEMAERLEVTEELLAEALESYRMQYGEGKQVGNFWISFEPYLAVIELT